MGRKPAEKDWDLGCSYLTGLSESFAGMCAAPQNGFDGQGGPVFSGLLSLDK